MGSFQWNNKDVLIVADGLPIETRRLRELYVKAQVIIGVDGGTSQLLEAELHPDVVIGDMDSLDEKSVETLVKQGVQLDKYPVEKDATDSELALRIAKESGASSATVVSGIGSRIDHSLSNLLLLGRYAGFFRRLRLETPLGSVYYITPDHNNFTFNLAAQRPFSVIALSPRLAGLTITGAKYTLRDVDLYWGSSLGVSNEGLGGEVGVTLSAGVCVVIIPSGD